MVVDENTFLWGAHLTGDFSYSSLSSATNNSAVIKVGIRQKNPINVNIKTGTIDGNGTETYSIQIQSNSVSDFTSTGDLVNETAYTIDKSWSNTEKVFPTNLTHEYIRAVLTIGNSGSGDFAVWID